MVIFKLHVAESNVNSLNMILSNKTVISQGYVTRVDINEEMFIVQDYMKTRSKQVKSGESQAKKIKHLNSYKVASSTFNYLLNLAANNANVDPQDNDANQAVISLTDLNKLVR